MPLSILLPMVVLGIAGIAVLLHVLGLSNPAQFADETAARRAWLREYPDDPPIRIVLSQDRHAALVRTRHGPGIVWPMGADSTARYLDGAQITAADHGLHIALPDYTAPRIALKLAPEEARLWPGLMETSR